MGAISLADESNTYVTGMTGFVGMTARPADEGGYYAKFATPEHGVAAASKNLENYGSKGIDTPSQIVRKWARDGNQNYIDTVVSYLNQAGFDVNSNSQLNLSDPKVRAAILRGKSAFESGAGIPVYNDEVYDAGVNYSVQSIEAAAQQIQELNSVLTDFDPNTINQLDDRLQKWYKDSSRTELQRKQFEASLSKLGIEQFNETMKRQPVNSATLMSAPGAPIMLPVSGSMAGKSIISEEDVPFSGGAPGSRSFGGPRGTDQLHTGVDIPGAPGDPVIAVDNGTVVGMRKSPSGYGYILDVQYPDNTVHRMAHLGVNGGGEESAYAEGLKVGDTVSAGQQIGIMGYSGNAGAEFPHVHYEVIRQDYYEKTQGSPPGRISGRGDAAEQQLEAGRMDPREWYAKRQEEFLKQQEQAIASTNSDPVTAAQNNMETATPLPTEQPPTPPPSEQTVEAPPAVIAPGLSIGGTVPMTPGENVVGINTTTGKTEFVSNDRELYTKDDQGNLRVDPSTIRQEDQKAQMASAEPEATQKPQPEQPKQSRPQQPMPASTPDPNFLNTMTSGSMASSPSQLRALNRAKLYNENSSGLVNGHFS
jgi:murein DD-endopeptidase MepM/ murein hydrolase activator NlpD